MAAPPLPPYAAVLLAGGAGARLGRGTKPLVLVGGVALVVRVLAAVPDANPRIVVGPRDLVSVVPPDVVVTSEEPAGGGPVAGLAAGLAQLPTNALAHTESPVPTGTERPTDIVALLAADLPLLTVESVRVLLTALTTRSDADGAVFVDESGHYQWLCGVWRTHALRDRLAHLGTPAGRGMREVCQPLTIVAVTSADLYQPIDSRRHSTADQGSTGPPSWLDCDTPEDLRRAEEFLTGQPQDPGRPQDRGDHGPRGRKTRRS